MNYQNLIEDNFDSYIEDLKSLVRIPSVFREDHSKKPFGSAIDRSLKTILKISDRLGFKTYYDPEGYYGYAEVGQGEELIGVLGHIDVVPAEDLDKWHSHPFDPVIRDGKIYGRGTQDDKGPTLAALYAVHALYESGIAFNKRVRFIFGTDEETLWRGINAYSEREEMPSYGFSPDSKFPLIHAEKALIQAKLIGNGMTGVSIRAGEAFNSVPANASYEGMDRSHLENVLNSLGFDFDSCKSSTNVVGKSVHAQVADTGVNAAARLCIALRHVSDANNAIRFVSEQLAEDAHAEKIFGKVEDAISGKLKVNLGKLKVDDNISELSMDLRIPISADVEMIKSKLKKSAESYGMEFIVHDYLRPVYVPLESKLVKTLMTSYASVTGDQNSRPLAAGGATYARALDNCVAFGTVFPGRKKTEHQPNENIQLGDLKLGMMVYADAIKRLLVTDIL